MILTLFFWKEKQKIGKLKNILYELCLVPKKASYLILQVKTEIHVYFWASQGIPGTLFKRHLAKQEEASLKVIKLKHKLKNVGIHPLTGDCQCPYVLSLYWQLPYRPKDVEAHLLRGGFEGNIINFLISWLRNSRRLRYVSIAFAWHPVRSSSVLSFK